MAINVDEELSFDKTKDSRLLMQCEACNAESWHVVHSSVHHKIIYPVIAEDEVNYEDAEWYEGIYEIIQCQGCREVKFRVRKTDFHLAEEATVEGRSIYSEEVYPKYSELEPFGILLSRANFDKDLRFMFGESKQSNNPLALIICDIDNFKQVNDTRGHEAGDVVLKAVMEILKQVVKGKGKAYRYGGEELALLLPNYTTREAEFLAEMLRDRIERQKIPYASGKDIQVTASFGVGASDWYGDSSSLFSDVDSAVLDAKRSGRNKVEIAIPF